MWTDLGKDCCIGWDWSMLIELGEEPVGWLKMDGQSLRIELKFENMELEWCHLSHGFWEQEPRRQMVGLITFSNLSFMYSIPPPPHPSLNLRRALNGNSWCLQCFNGCHIENWLEASLEIIYNTIKWIANLSECILQHCFCLFLYTSQEELVDQWRKCSNILAASSDLKS